jgi:hypothetical protein
MPTATGVRIADPGPDARPDGDRREPMVDRRQGGPLVARLRRSPRADTGARPVWPARSPCPPCYERQRPSRADMSAAVVPKFGPAGVALRANRPQRWPHSRSQRCRRACNRAPPVSPAAPHTPDASREALHGVRHPDEPPWESLHGARAPVEPQSPQRPVQHPSLATTQRARAPRGAARRSILPTLACSVARATRPTARGWSMPGVGYTRP